MKRVQRKRSKGWKLPDNTVCVDRSSRWGNPFKVGQQYGDLPWPILDKLMRRRYIDQSALMDNSAVTEAFRIYLACTNEGMQLLEKAKKQLAGKDLACWCKLDQCCHADVYIDLLREPVSVTQNGRID